jgi:hypothetical protein
MLMSFPFELLLCSKSSIFQSKSTEGVLGACSFVFQKMSAAGLPNPNFRKQEFFLKNQDLIRRFFSKNQEKNQEIFS